MSDLIKRRPRRTSFTRSAAGSYFKYVAVLAVVAVTTLIVIVPFLIAIVNATGPGARVSAVPGAGAVTRPAPPTFGPTLPGYR
jgi:hypothetical protein